MDCLIHDFFYNSECTDFPNWFTLILEMIGGGIIAGGIFYKQKRDKDKRKSVAIFEVSYRLFEVDSLRVELGKLVKEENY